MPVKRSHSTLVFFKGACYAIRGAEKSFVGSKLHENVQIRSFSGSYFPIFGVNTERYSVSLRIQSKCWKIRKGEKSVFTHFSRSEVRRY